MPNESLPEYLDRLIERVFVSRKFSGPRSNQIDADNLAYFIEDEVTGRPCPIDDSADHFLLRTFHAMREDYLTRPLPIYVEPAPVCGEIPWRNMHVEVCRTCKRPTDEGVMYCSASSHLNIRTKMTADQPGVVREISKAIPLRKEDEE